MISFDIKANDETLYVINTVGLNNPRYYLTCSFETVQGCCGIGIVFNITTIANKQKELWRIYEALNEGIAEIAVRESYGAIIITDVVKFADGKKNDKYYSFAEFVEFNPEWEPLLDPPLENPNTLNKLQMWIRRFDNV